MRNMQNLLPKTLNHMFNCSILGFYGLDNFFKVFNFLVVHYMQVRHIRKTYILLYHAFLCFFMLYHAFSCFSVKAREKYKKSNPPYFSKCLGIWLKKYIGLLVKSRHVLFKVLLFFLQKAPKARKSMKKHDKVKCRFS